MPEEVRARSLQTGRWCPRPPAGTQSHGIKLWQPKKCRLEIRRGFSSYGVSVAPVVWFELGLKTPSLEGTGYTQLFGVHQVGPGWLGHGEEDLIFHL